MDERIKRLMYLNEYDNRKNKKIIKETVENLFESKQTEQQAVNILTQSQDIDEALAQRLIQEFKTVDQTKNQALLPVMATALVQQSKNSVVARHLGDIKQTFATVAEMVNSNKISIPQITEAGYVINGKTFPDYLRLTEYIHGLQGMAKGHAEWKGSINIETDEPPIFPKEGQESDIWIYDGNDIGKCIKYTTGGLTGKHYGFCIGQPANTMWQSYRDTQVSTFYYVIDKSLDLSNPLHIVVVDVTDSGIQLTDMNNSTFGPYSPHGSIAEYGQDVDAYINHLKSKGVPTDMFVNIKKTPDEEAEAEKLGNQNQDINWFKNLSYLEKSKYIGRGHPLSDDQFKYLWQFKNDKGGYHLLHQLVDTGQALPEEQFNILVGEEQ